MIMESEREFPGFDIEPYERMDPLVDVDHNVPPAFAAFLARRQEVRNSNTHHQLQDDLVEHLWTLKCGD
jgi:hypothetical protein